MRLQIIVFFTFFISFFGATQNDTTTQKKEIIIQEITVTGAKGTSEKKTPDLQQQTDKIMSEMTGVTLIKRGNYAQEPIIRGLNAGQITTTIDGMHIFGACTDRMDPVSSYVEPNNLSGIRLNLGPNEDQQSGQIGGGLDFKLLKAQPDATKRVSGRVGLGFETNALAIQSLGSLQYSRRRWAIQVNGIFRKANNYQAANQQTILFSQYEKFNVGGNFVGVINEYHKVYVDYLQDNGKNIGYPALTMDVAFANAKIASVTHNYSRSGKRVYRWESKAYFNFIDHAMDDTKRPPEMVPMHMDMPGTSRTAGFYSGGAIRLTHKQFLNVKVTGYQNDLHAEMTMYPDNGNEMFMLTIPDARRTNLGVNISDKIYVGNSTDLLIGGRLEYIASSITTLIGRQTVTSLYAGNPDKSNVLYNAFLQVNQKIGKKTILYGGLTRALRNPTLQEMYGFYLYNRMDAHDYLGNPDLKPESSWNLNFGSKVNYSKIAFNGQIFAYFFSDYITGIRMDDYSVMTIGGAGVKQYANIPNALIYGAELTAEWKITDQLIFQSLNSVSIGQDNDGDALPFIPPFRSLNKVQYDLKGYLFKVEYVTATAQERVSTVKYGEKRTPSFHLLNLGISKKFVFEKVAINGSLALDNVFDRAYYEHLDVMKINRQGRNLILHLTLVF